MEFLPLENSFGARMLETTDFNLGLIYVVANTADRAYMQLSLTIGDDSAYRSAVSTIGNLSKKTLSSKGDVEAMVSELAALG